MEAIEIQRHITELIKKEFPYNKEIHEPAGYLAHDFVMQNNVNLSANFGRKKLRGYLRELYPEDEFRPKEHRPDYETEERQKNKYFENEQQDEDDTIGVEDNLPPDINDPTSADNAFEALLQRVHIPAEVHAELKMLRDKAYKSFHVANLSKTGRQKNIRKAEIYMHLLRNNHI